MKLSSKQYKEIVVKIYNDPKLNEIWKKKLFYIYDGYLTKLTEALDVVPESEAARLFVKLGGNETDLGSPAGSVGITIAGLALFDSFNAMAADILTVGEMRIAGNDKRTGS